MSQIPAFVAGPAHHGRTGPEGAVPVAQGLPRSRPPPRPAVVAPTLKGSVRGALPEGAFSEVPPWRRRFLLAYRDVVNPLEPASIAAASPSSRHYSVRVYRRSTGLSTPALPTSQDYSGTQYASRHPSPDYEPGMRGISAVHPVTRYVGRWFSCPSPAQPCSEFQLVLGPSADTPRLPRPLRPSRACRASRLTGYLNASG